MSKKPDRQPIEPDDIDISLIETAERILAEYFFDPDNEDIYRQQLSARRSRPAGSVILDEATVDVFDSPCTVRLEAMRTWTMFRVAFSHRDFGASVEGSWSFDNQELLKPKVSDRRGDRETLQDAIDQIDEYCFSTDPEDDIDELDGMVDPEEAEDDDYAAALIGDNPAEPPAATAVDRSRIKAIAKRLVRQPGTEIKTEDHIWLTQAPQTLPVITEALIAAAETADADDPAVTAYGVLLSMQLELVRYRQDRGWAWADTMLRDFQQRLLTFASQGGNPIVFMMMAQAMTQAKIPVSDDMQHALAEAGFTDEDVGTAEQLAETMQVTLDEMAAAMDTPFQVIETLGNAGAVMPSDMRGFLTDLLARSSHDIMRQAAGLMILDPDPAVRQGAVAALTETARPETLAPATLRRIIAVRNWLPEHEREAVDTLIRKARLAGVEIGSWPKMPPDAEYHASMIDGSGAQSIIVVSRGHRTGSFRALLLRHGKGIVDAWEDADLSRGRLTQMLRSAQQEVPMAKVSRDFVDSMVQHALGCAVETQTVPPPSFLQVAEGLNGVDWKARRLDIAGESERLTAEPPAADRRPDDRHTALTKAAGYLTDTQTLSTWFEEGPHVAAALKTLPRNDPERLAGAVMADILPNRRAIWAERFLLMSLWCQASSDPRYRRMTMGMAATANALTRGVPLEHIAAMGVIARQTVTCALAAPW